MELAACGGYFTPAESVEILARVDAFNPHILLLGMGMPRQESWALHNLSSLGNRVVLMSGGLMDYVAGATPVPRAGSHGWASSGSAVWQLNLAVSLTATRLSRLRSAWLLVRNGLRR